VLYRYLRRVIQSPVKNDVDAVYRTMPYTTLEDQSSDVHRWSGDFSVTLTPL
jgi:hypothetical protein